MFVSFLPMAGMLVFMRPVVISMAVPVLRAGIMAMTVCMDVLVLMAVFMTVFVGMGLTAVNMLVGVNMPVIMGMHMFVFVGSFHGIASSPIALQQAVCVLSVVRVCIAKR